MPRKRAPKAVTASTPAPKPSPYIYEHREPSEPAIEDDNSTSSSPPIYSSLEEFSASLANLLEGSDQAFIPELCDFHLHFAPNATFLVDLSRLPSLEQTLPKKASGTRATETGEKAQDLYLLSTVGAMNASDDTADRLAKQKAVARAIVNAVQEVDGYKYQHARQRGLKEQGSHLTYFCNDSQQNKERMANNTKKAVATEDAPEEGGEGGATKKKRNSILPTYDCKGAVTVKFDSKAQVLDVGYRHMMLHRETAWRSQKQKPANSEEAEARRERRKKAKEEREKEAGIEEVDPATGKRKRGRKSAESKKKEEARERNGVSTAATRNENLPPASWRPADGSADGSNLDTLAELLKADIDDMNRETAAAAAALGINQNVTSPADNGHATSDKGSDDGDRKKVTREGGACLTCRKRRVKVGESPWNSLHFNKPNTKAQKY